MALSPTDAIGPAINRAKLMTFQPFDLGRWFTLGFIAWLSTLADGSGARFQFQFPTGSRAPIPPPAPVLVPPGGGRISQVFTTSNSWDLGHWISVNLPLAVLIGFLIMIAGVAFWLLLTWLDSRGKFMFLEAIANNTTEISGAWKRHRAQANSLFWFRAAIVSISTLITALVAVVALIFAWNDIREEIFRGGSVVAILIALVTLTPCWLALGLINWCTDNFVSTIMYATGETVLPAWREFRTQVLPGNVGTFVLFLLLRIVFAIALIFSQMLLGCLTCCIGFLPYVSTVVALPLVVFMRAHAVYFLQQVGTRYMIIVEMPPPPPLHAFPVIPMPPRDAPPPQV